MQTKIIRKPFFIPSTENCVNLEQAWKLLNFENRGQFDWFLRKSEIPAVRIKGEGYTRWIPKFRLKELKELKNPPCGYKSLQELAIKLKSEKSNLLRLCREIEIEPVTLKGRNNVLWINEEQTAKLKELYFKTFSTVEEGSVKFSDILRYFSLSKPIIINISKVLNLTPKKISGEGNSKFFSKEQVLQIESYIKQNGIENLSISGKACDICGNFGHLNHNCPSVEKRTCKQCGEEKTPGEFYQRNDYLSRRKINTFSISNTCKECTCKNKLKFKSFDEKFKDLLVKINYRHPQNEMSIEFLKELYKKQNGICFYSGFEMTFESGDYAVSVDQVSPGLGYFKNNVVLCCWIINRIKSDIDVTRFKELCLAVTKHNNL